VQGVVRDLRSGAAKVCSKCGEIKLQKEFVFQKGSSIRVGRICVTCKSLNTYRKYFSENNSTQSYISDGLSKRDVNKLLSFSESPEKYATGTSRAIEKVQHLESIKHKFSDGQLATYTIARKKYDTALTEKTSRKSVPKVDYSSVLTEAFNNNRSVKIRYKGAWRTIDPYSLNNTYVVAYCHSARDIRTFRVDRIQGAEISEAFNFDKILQTTAQSRLIEAPNYRGYRRRY